MLRFLTSLGNVVVLLLAVLFTGVVIFLGQSAFWIESGSVLVRPLLAAVAIFAFIWPRNGLLLVAALVPLGQIGARRLDSPLRGPEALVLAYLAGALLRGWWSGRIRRFPSGRVETAALLFGLVVAASCVEQLWFLQIQRNFPWAFVQDMAAYGSREYLAVFRGLGMIFNAMLFFEGLALLVLATHWCRLDPALSLRLIGMLVVGAVGAAAVNASASVPAFLDARGSVTRFLSSMSRRELTVHIGDPNAAASFFVMTFFIAIGGGLIQKKERLAWFGAAFMIALGLWITRSRTALIATLVVSAAVVATIAFSRMTNRFRALGLTLLVVIPLTILTLRFTPVAFSGPRAGNAVSVRWMFLATTLRMLEWQPAFGVGIGQYSLWSRHFSSPEFLALYRPENAHNNFSQVAGELGLVGLVAFLWLLASVVLRPRRVFEMNPAAQVGLVGLAGCMFTWLGGHPLLVPAVAYPFWILLGVTASADARPATPTALTGHRFSSRPAILAALVVALLAVSLPRRLEQKVRTLDWARIDYGFYDWERGPSGERFRWMGTQARFFVPADVARLAIRLRANAVTPENPIRVDLFVDNRLANQIEMSDAAWRTLPLPFPPIPSGHHYVDLRVSRTWVPADVIPGSTDSRRLGVQVGEPVVQAAREPGTGGA